MLTSHCSQFTHSSIVQIKPQVPAVSPVRHKTYTKWSPTIQRSTNDRYLHTRWRNDRPAAACARAECYCNCYCKQSVLFNWSVSQWTAPARRACCSCTVHARPSAPCVPRHPTAGSHASLPDSVNTASAFTPVSQRRRNKELAKL